MVLSFWFQEVFSDRQPISTTHNLEVVTDDADVLTSEVLFSLYQVIHVVENEIFSTMNIMFMGFLKKDK